MKEIRGVVEWTEKGQMQPPDSVFGKLDGRYIPILNLRIRTSSGDLVQIQYKGETSGIVKANDQITVRGRDIGGVIHAESIFNDTTNSWIAKRSQNCFIVVAASSLNNPHEISAFEKLRDEFVGKNIFGKWLIVLYYLISPPIGVIIRKNELLRKGIITFFLKPVSRLLNKFLNRGY